MSELASTTNEKALQRELSLFFKRLEEQVVDALEEYWSDTILLQGQMDLILSPVHESLREYYELILEHKVQEFQRASRAAERIVKRTMRSYAMKAAEPVTITATEDNLFGTLEQAEGRMASHTFTACDSTLARVDDSLMELLLEGYKSGVGINAVTAQLRGRFDQLETWEAQRIARTEIHNAQNIGIMETYHEMGVEYTQWVASGDVRTRESHAELDGEIIPFGGTYSNGLEYPGDTNGEKSEWINCRCSNAPFVMPAGMMAPPGKNQFREEDLVEVGSVPDVTEPEPVETTEEIVPLSEQEANKLSFKELAEHYGAEYQGVQVYDYDGKKYHTFVQKFSNGESLTIRMEDKAVKSYTKAGKVMPNEIINQVFKVPEYYRRQTNEIWFKNTQLGILHKPTKRLYDTLGSFVGGYNAYKTYNQRNWGATGPNHRIVINPKYFKESKGLIDNWKKDDAEARDWKHSLYHEFAHSVDHSREAWDLNATRDLSEQKPYTDAMKAEPHFTWYANTSDCESFAEHGGYISRMLANPQDQSKKITIETWENGKRVNKDINFKEYKKMYPEHYNYFIKLFNGDIPWSNNLPEDDPKNHTKIGAKFP